MFPWDFAVSCEPCAVSVSRSHLVSLPRDGHQGEHTDTHCQKRGERVYLAIDCSEIPLSKRVKDMRLNISEDHLRLQILPVQHEDKARDAVEHRHGHIRHGQVNQEVVGDAPHPPVRWTESLINQTSHKSPPPTKVGLYYKLFMC